MLWLTNIPILPCTLIDLLFTQTQDEEKEKRATIHIYLLDLNL